MNSAINELIPARVRGWVDLAVNGSYWIGAVLASAVSIGLLDTSRFRIDIGKRLIIYFSSLCSIRLIFFSRLAVAVCYWWRTWTHNHLSAIEVYPRISQVVNHSRKVFHC